MRFKNSVSTEAERGGRGEGDFYGRDSALTKTEHATRPAA